jgi:hypothetical protein
MVLVSLLKYGGAISLIWPLMINKGLKRNLFAFCLPVVTIFSPIQQHQAIGAHVEAHLRGAALRSNQLTYLITATCATHVRASLS